MELRTVESLVRHCIARRWWPRDRKWSAIQLPAIQLSMLRPLLPLFICIHFCMWCVCTCTSLRVHLQRPKEDAGCPALSPSISLSFETKPLTEPGVKLWPAILSSLPASTIRSIRVTARRGHNLLFHLGGGIWTQIFICVQLLAMEPSLRASTHLFNHSTFTYPFHPDVQSIAPHPMWIN